jgi:hypothetical protein
MRKVRVTAPTSNSSTPIALSEGVFANHGDGLIFRGDVSGKVQMNVVDTAGTNFIGVPAASGMLSLDVVEDCGTTSTCAKTVLSNPIIVKGTVALSSGTPSTATITAPPFTATGSYVCIATDQTSTSALKVANASASSTVIAGPNTVTDTIGYQCTGS